MSIKTLYKISMSTMLLTLCFLLNPLFNLQLRVIGGSMIFFLGGATVSILYIKALYKE
jgi:hypothetical protein